jgi:2-dehydro-3-deoxyphosphogluconate aldolase/(4S)-4-hydroxy-2-oxoglutarate aldolase
MTFHKPSRPSLPETISRGRVVTIVRGDFSPDAIVRMGEALLGAGIGAIEVTLNSPGALASIERLSERFAPGELTVGAGTVLDLAGAQQAIDAGARFLVTPSTDPTVIGWSARRGIPILPGAMTATEVNLAWSSGASAVKLFPGSVGGPGYLRDLAAPLGHIPLIAVGGVSADNAADFLRAGARGVALSSWLVGDGTPDGVAQRARALMANLRDA